MKKLHVVLGGSGAVGASVIKELQANHLPVRSVERTKEVTDVDNIHADLLDLDSLEKAVEGSSHIYICIGLPYRSNIWARDWPTVIKNVVSAAETVNAKVIFFDNVYMYGPHPLPVPFDENTSQEPTTKKGVARKQSADIFMKAVAEGRIQGFIARSADFYGPGAVNSPFFIKFLENIEVGKNPQFLGKKGVKHTYTFLPDAAKAIVRLAQDETAYGQVWHMPTTEPVTIDEVMTTINSIKGTQHSVQYLPPMIRKVVSIFTQPVKEASEMLYQFDEPYVMSWDKLLTKYSDIATTPLEQGLRVMIESLEATTAKSNL